MIRVRKIELSELVLSMNAGAKNQSSGPNTGCPNARRLTCRTDCAGGNLCVYTKRKDELYQYSCEVRQQMLEQLRVEQIEPPLLHVAQGTSMTSPQPLPPEPRRTQLSVRPSVDKDSTESFVAGTLVPMQSAHHAESVMEKCQADADEIVGMLEAITRSYKHVDPSPIGSFYSRTASLADSFSIRKSVSSTANSFGQVAEPSIGCLLQQPAIRQHSSLQSPNNSALLNRSSYNYVVHRLPLHAYSIIDQAERSQLRSDSQQNFYSHRGPSEAGYFCHQRQDLNCLPEHASVSQQLEFAADRWLRSIYEASHTRAACSRAASSTKEEEQKTKSFLTPQFRRKKLIGFLKTD
mmetsp:Transcript_32821/g.81708  ORF Transcript_32821/g.81708 Transcript_32821/m.81708 type:complete len:350 (+) Transcript_32821:11-1060(+)